MSASTVYRQSGIGDQPPVTASGPSAVGLRPPTTAELVRLIQQLPPGPERDFLEDAYWAKAADLHGVRRAGWYRQESRWLREAGW